MPGHHTSCQHWEREICIANVVDFEQASAQGMSQRAFADQQGVPRTTLQYWLSRKHTVDAAPALVAFFESPDGLAFCTGW